MLILVHVSHGWLGAAVVDASDRSQGLGHAGTWLQELAAGAYTAVKADRGSWTGSGCMSSCKGLGYHGGVGGRGKSSEGVSSWCQ